MDKLINTIFLVFFCLFFQAQKNTILIIADDVSPDYFGFYNESADTANTPNIRKLLAKGIYFKKAWGSTLCSTTRASIITGKYPFRTGIAAVITNSNSPQLDTAEMTVSKLLKYYAPNNYNTACVGKWHLTSNTPSKYLYPNKCGYDYYSGNFNGAIPNYYNYMKVTNGVASTVTAYATTQTVDDAITWLGGMNVAKPYFLWLAFNAPHSPLHVPPSNLTTVTGLLGTTADVNANPDKYFKAAIEAMDTEIGRLFTYLTANNLMDSTNIIFIGDNGNDTQVSQNPIKTKSKNTLYNYGVRVPFIISGPSVINPNRGSDALVQVTDIFSTILELNRFYNWASFIPTNKLPIDSKSLLPLVKNSVSKVRDWTFTQQFTNPVNVTDGKTIRNNDYHLMRLDNGTEEFYNQTTDNFENSNLINTTMSVQDVFNYHQLCDTLNSIISGSVCLPLGASELTKNTKVEIAPNPAHTSIRIACDSDVEKCEVIDYSGRILIAVKASNINIESLSKGVYLIKVYFIGKSHCYTKFVKE